MKKKSKKQGFSNSQVVCSVTYCHLMRQIDCVIVLADYLMVVFFKKRGRKHKKEGNLSKFANWHD